MRPTGGHARLAFVTLLLLATACTGSTGSARTPTRSERPPATPSEGPSPITAAAADPVAETTLVWTQGGLPPDFGQQAAGLPGIQHAATVVGGTVWLTRSYAASSEVVDQPPAGMAIPLDLAGASPKELEPFLPVQDRHLLGDLATGRAILGATSARLRRLGPGATLTFGSRSVKVAGVVPDAVIGGHELLVSRRTAAALGITAEQYLLVQAAGHLPEHEIRALVPPGTQMRIRPPGEAHFLRQADAVLPPVMLKAAFGEFAASPDLLPGEYLRMSGAWRAAHIVTASVPILGSVTCNAALIPQLRGALMEAQRRGLASLIHTNDYGGCFAPRIIPGSIGHALSAHAFGGAIDINVHDNLVGAVPHQDPRLVAIFQRWGFTWGGWWMRPDGMHFEFQCFPHGLGPPGVLVCPPGGAIWPPHP
ncbi:MAG: M15 family metallopeptidase [Planctomycetaceae bacterium]